MNLYTKPRRADFQDFPEMNSFSEDSWLNCGWSDDGKLLYDRRNDLLVQAKVAEIEARQLEYENRLRPLKNPFWVSGVLPVNKGMGK